MREYASLKAGHFKPDALNVIAELPPLLIKARIAQGLNLAERLNLKEQQIQRYEATAYALASPTLKQGRRKRPWRRDEPISPAMGFHQSRLGATRRQALAAVTVRQNHSETLREEGGSRRYPKTQRWSDRCRDQRNLIDWRLAGQPVRHRQCPHTTRPEPESSPASRTLLASICACTLCRTPLTAPCRHEPVLE